MSCGARALIILFVVLAGLSLRYCYHARSFVITRDGAEYLGAAIEIEQEGLPSLRDSARQPLYPFALWLAGRTAQIIWPPFSWRGVETAEAGRWLGLFLYLPFLAASWFFFRRIVETPLAIVCLFILAVHPLFGSYFANVLSETLYLTFFIAGLACLVKAVSLPGPAGKSLYWAFAAGLSGALSFLVRVEGQLLLATAVVCLAAETRKRTSARFADSKRRWLAPLGALSGFAVVALPVMLYLGATAQRYSWGWVWQRLVASAAPAGEPAVAGIQFQVAPLIAVRMLCAELLTRAPFLCAAAAAAGALALHRSMRRGQGATMAPEVRVAATCVVLYAALVVAGVSIQNGTVSLRYIQPIALIGLPLVARLCDYAVGGAAGRLAASRRFAVVGVPSSIVVFALAVYFALDRWDRSKIGYRLAGAAVRDSAPAEGLLTSSAQIAFYADSGAGLMQPAELKAEILGGGTTTYGFVVVQTKYFTEEEVQGLFDALSRQNYRSGNELDFSESADADDVGNRIVVFSKGAQASASL